jgi:hypothetical protein
LSGESSSGKAAFSGKAQSIRAAAPWQCPAQRPLPNELLRIVATGEKSDHMPA